MITATGLAAGCRLPGALLDTLGWPAPGAQAAVVLFVRGAWCPVCRRQIARYAASADELAALGVPLFIVSTAEASEYAVDPLLGELPLTYVTDTGGAIITSLGIAADHPDHGVIARPTTLIIDPAGVVAYGHVGSHPRDRPEPDAILLAVRHYLAFP